MTQIPVNPMKEKQETAPKVASFNHLAPGAPLTNFNDGDGGGGGGGPTEVNILYPKKSQLQNLNFKKITTVYTRVQVEFFGRENGLKKSTSTYIRENTNELVFTSELTFPVRLDGLIKFSHQRV